MSFLWAAQAKSVSLARPPDCAAAMAAVTAPDGSFAEPGAAAAGAERDGQRRRPVRRDARGLGSNPSVDLPFLRGPSRDRRECSPSPGRDARSRSESPPAAALTSAAATGPGPGPASDVRGDGPVPGRPVAPGRGPARVLVLVADARAASPAAVFGSEPLVTVGVAVRPSRVERVGRLLAGRAGP